MSTITDVGAATSVTAVNAAVTPTFPSGVLVNDLIIIQASIRNSGVGDIPLPAGWSNLIYSGHHRIFARFYQAGDTPPTITPTSGVAGADVIAQCAAFRGVSPEVLTALSSAALSNGSAQNIAYPGLAMPKGRHAAILAAWKQAAMTTVSTPAGFTAKGTASATAGDDAAQTLQYVIQTTAADIAGGTLTVTGGAAAISRAFVFALKPAASIVATAQDVWPPRVLVSVTDLTLGDSVAVYRSVGGERTLVRAGSDDSVSDPSFLRVDAELPFGVPVAWVAVVNGVEYATAATTYDLPGDRVALSDAVGGQSAEVVIPAWPEKAYNPRTSMFKPGGRNVLLSGELGMYEGEISLFLTSSSAVRNVMDLLRNATEATVQIRQAGGYDGVDSYVSYTGVRERRYSQDGSDERRYLILQAVEVESWAPALEARGFTLQDIADVYTGLTLNDIATNFATLLAIAQGDFST